VSIKIPETELILNPDGSVYHLHLRPEHLAPTIFTVGDPDRVKLVSKHFDRIEFQISKREFITHTGYIGNTRVSVLSTGMGTDNIEILMTELDALVNIDLDSRHVKETKQKLQIIRLGTSGALQADIPVGSILASQKAIGLDTLFQFYPDLQSNQTFAQAVKEKLGLNFTPYETHADRDLLKLLPSTFLLGCTLTAPGFYAPQGRAVRLKPRIDSMLKKVEELVWNGDRITNFEMETSGYYGLGELLGHRMLSLNAIVANRVTQEFDKKAEKTMEKLIHTALEVYC
jgi:uridine phosphorylase